MRRQGPLVITESWETTFNALCAPRASAEPTTRRVIAVVGPKGAGKSTFAVELFRRLNALESDKAKKRPALRIGFLDTDLGRPEFTLPGLVSLHVADNNDKAEDGGGVRLEAAVFLGEDDPAQRPEDYLRAIKSLGELIQPYDFVVINTHGWFSGLGQDVLEALLVSTGATDVVQIVPENKMTALGSLLRPSEAFKIWTLAPAKEGRQREAKSVRDRRMVDHFTKEASMYCVGLAKVKIKYPVDVIDRSLPPAHALLAINASLVGLCRANADEPRSFLGVGLVCSVDAQKQCLFILSRLNMEQIRECEVIVPGTSARIPLHLFPTRFQPDEDDNTIADVDLEGEDDDEQFVPYLTTSKLTGFGSGATPQRGVLKRRRLDTGGGE